MYLIPFSDPCNKAQAHFQMDYVELGLSCPLWPIFKWIIPNLASHAHYGPFKVDFDFIQRIYYLFEASREFSYIRRFRCPLLINEIRPIILGRETRH